MTGLGRDPFRSSGSAPTDRGHAEAAATVMLLGLLAVAGAALVSAMGSFLVTGNGLADETSWLLAAFDTTFSAVPFVALALLAVVVLGSLSSLR